MEDGCEISHVAGVTLVWREGKREVCAGCDAIRAGMRYDRTLG